MSKCSITNCPNPSTKNYFFCKYCLALLPKAEIDSYTSTCDKRYLLGCSLRIRKNKVEIRKQIESKKMELLEVLTVKQRELQERIERIRGNVMSSA